METDQSGGVCVCARIRQKAHRHNDAHGDRRRDHPERGLFVAQRVLHARAHAHLAEGERTGGKHTPRHAARKQRARIVLDLPRVHAAQHALVAGQLDVAAEQGIGKPQQRVEPVDRQQGKAQRLPPVVTPREVRALMREHTPPLRLVQRGGQIDARAQDAEDERRGDLVANINILPQRNGGAHAPPQPQIAHERVEQHRREADEPHPAREIGPHIEQVDACQRRGGKALAQRRVHRVVDELHAARDGRCGIELHDLGAEGLRARDQAQRALDGERQHQAQRDHAPEQDVHPLRGPFKHEAQHQHDQHQPARRNAQIEELEKNNAHTLTTPFRMRRSSPAARRPPPPKAPCAR